MLIEHQRSYIKELSFDSSTDLLNFKFVRKLNLNRDIISLKFNNECLISSDKRLEWQNETNDSAEDSEYWHGSLADFPFGNDFMTSVKAQNQIKIEMCLKNTGFSNEILLNRKEGETCFEYKSNIDIKDLNLGSELMVNHLKNILDLSEMESENSKWCLLTAVELMCSIDFDEHRETVFAYLDKLAGEVDVYRKNYYLDLKKKICANNKV